MSALDDALESEYAAVYLYGVIAAYANTLRAEAISAASKAHRTRRDVLLSFYPENSAPQAAPAYYPPQPINNPIPAIAAAEIIEKDCATAYLALAEADIEKILSQLSTEKTADVRRFAVDTLVSVAQQQAQWRLALNSETVTTPFPGQN